MPVRYRQAPPFAMQIELVEGCNLRCSFCGLNGIRGKDNNFKFMQLATASKVVDRIVESGWTPRIEFAMHGEPSVHPHMIDILAMFRTALPKLHMMMTSNGVGFMKQPNITINAVLQHLNVLAIDWYENVKIVPRILQQYTGQHIPQHYPKQKEANPHRRRGINEHDLVIVQDISTASSGTHSTLNNHAGAGAPLDYSANGKRCAKPFRELAIRWDGNVAICCNDWRGAYKVGNVATTSLDGLWQHPAMQAARRKLYHGQRDFGPCHGCNATSYRPGLLPDQRGKLTLPKPDKNDLAQIEKALAGSPFTLPVLRSWEQ